MSVLVVSHYKVFNSLLCKISPGCGSVATDYRHECHYNWKFDDGSFIRFVYNPSTQTSLYNLVEKDENHVNIVAENLRDYQLVIYIDEYSGSQEPKTKPIADKLIESIKLVAKKNGQFSQCSSWFTGITQDRGTSFGNFNEENFAKFYAFLVDYIKRHDPVPEVPQFPSIGETHTPKEVETPKKDEGCVVFLNELPVDEEHVALSSKPLIDEKLIMKRTILEEMLEEAKAYQIKHQQKYQKGFYEELAHKILSTDKLVTDDIFKIVQKTHNSYRRSELGFRDIEILTRKLKKLSSEEA